MYGARVRLLDYTVFSAVPQRFSFLPPHSRSTALLPVLVMKKAVPLGFS